MIVVLFNQDIQRERLAAAAQADPAAAARSLVQVPSARYSGLPEPYRSQALAGEPSAPWCCARRASSAPTPQYTLTIPAGVYGEGPNASKALTASFAPTRR
jgi:hypothetical protein